MLHLKMLGRAFEVAMSYACCIWLLWRLEVDADGFLSTWNLEHISSCVQFSFFMQLSY